MLKQRKNRKDAGFTIIEVLIVLAIAGLILLIVFLAVPALQRNARNTQRKNDVAALLAAISETESNNGGALPTDNTFQSNAKLNYYTTNNVVWNATALSGSAAGLGDVDKVSFWSNATCIAATEPVGTNIVKSNGASSRSVAAVYTVENGGGTNQQVCQGS